jgi:hypothetical protein
VVVVTRENALQLVQKISMQMEFVKDQLGEDRPLEPLRIQYAAANAKIAVPVLHRLIRYLETGE